MFTAIRCAVSRSSQQRSLENVCIYVYTHTHIHVHIYTYIYIYLWVYRHISIYLSSIYLSVYLSIRLSTHPLTYPSIHLPIIYLASIYPSHVFTQILLILILNCRAYSSILLSILLTPFLKNEKSDSLIIHMFILGGQSSVLNQFFLSAASACSPYPQ